MKAIFKINLLVLTMTGLFLFAGGQQKPSQRSFTSVMNEVKQKQAARSKMIQQIKQTTPSNNTSQRASLQVQPGTDMTTTPASQQPSQEVQRSSQQPIDNRQTNQQPLPSTKTKKE